MKESVSSIHGKVENPARINPTSLTLEHAQRTHNELSSSHEEKKSFWKKLWPKKQNSPILQKTIEKKAEKKTLESILPTKKKEKRKISVLELKHRRKDWLEKAGIQLDPRELERWVLRISIATSIVLGLYAFTQFVLKDLSISGFAIFVTIAAVLGTPLVYLAIWLVTYIVIDMRIFQRTKQVESVLPEYLELCALNVKAGMPIDKALWFSVRPKFGVLAQEIELVAKRTLTGEELQTALRDFTKKFDSPTLTRSVSLIIEGIEAGGEIGGLLHKISADLQETSILKQEMASSVTTYVIFITFASIIAAPFLMALSYHLLNIIQGFAGRLGDTSTSSVGSSFSISPDAIVLEDYKIFAMVSLGITAAFSAAIISIIRHGNVKEGLRYVPFFIGCTIVLFFFGIRILGTFLGGVLNQ